VEGGYYDLEIEAWQNCQTGTLDWSEVDGFGGTAAAAAYVSGAVSAVLAANPDLTPEDAQEILIRTAEDHQLPVVGWDAEFGWGRPDLEGALGLASPPYAVWHTTFFTGEPFIDGTGRALFIDVPGLADGHYAFERHRVEVTRTVSHPFSGTPMGWGRSQGTIGWRRIDDETTYVDSDEQGWCKVVALSMTSITVRTYTYRLYRMDGSLAGTFPDGGRTAMSVSVLGPSSVLALTPADEDPFGAVRATPNPANDAVRVSFRGDRGARGATEVTIHDAAGRRVRAMSLHAGGEVVWDLRGDSGRRVAPGAYFVSAGRTSTAVKVWVAR
jgi:hypothetical protein